ncbi:MAG: YheC/YheD family protein [Syntrophomonas sp.]
MINECIYISNNLINRLDIPVQEEILVRVGSRIIKSRLIVSSSRKYSYMLSPSLARALLFKKHKRLKIRYDKHANIIHLGPTIGILSSFLPNREEFDPKSVQAELIYLSNIGRKISGQVYIFTPSSINWANKTTRGYQYRQLSSERGIWVSSEYPLPDVVYDRIPSRTSEAKHTISETKWRLVKLPYLKYFNPSFLNKWKVHQLLITNPELHPYLPETKHLNLVNLETMLLKYNTLFLKPANGSLGKGIIKLVQDEKGTLHYTIYRRGQTKSQAGNAAEFMKKTKVYRGERTYVVQQGIKLAKYMNSTFDIRIIFQKNNKGEWQVGKKFVRIAPRGSSISNLSSGGRAEKSKKVFRQLYKSQQMIDEKNQLIKVLCKKVADTLEKTSKSTFGELGLDIGVDINGFPWLIEVNSKPRKTTESEYSQGIVRNSFKRPLEYGSYLAGFGN